jgi:hypothetical protein
MGSWYEAKAYRVPDASIFQNRTSFVIKLRPSFRSLKIMGKHAHCSLYVFFWVIPRRLNFIYRRFGTLCLLHLHRQVGVKWPNLRIVWVFIREKVGSKISWTDWKEDDGVGVDPVTKQVVKGVMTHMEAAGGYVNEIWLVLGWAMGWQVKTIVL